MLSEPSAACMTTARRSTAAACTASRAPAAWSAAAPRGLRLMEYERQDQASV